MEAEYMAASEAAREAVWLRNIMMDLDVIPGLPKIIIVFWDTKWCSSKLEGTTSP